MDCLRVRCLQGRAGGAGALAVRYKAATDKGLVETGGSNKSQPLRLPFPNRVFPGLHSAC